VRELRNAIERLCVLRPGQPVGLADLPDAIAGRHGAPPTAQVRVGMSLQEIERVLIDQTLRAVEGNRTRAAEMLGISRRTLQRKLSGEEKGPGG